MHETTWQQSNQVRPNEPRATAPFSHPGLSATEAAIECFKEYSRERPEVVTLWAFGLGFVLGWKLRIW